jgi:hypothetical protein
MAKAVRFKGGPQLKARLASIPAGAPAMVNVWADNAAQRMRDTAPNATRAESKKFTTKVRGVRAAVYGAFWWIFVDRGAKRHTIYGSGRKNPPDTLMFSRGGRTIFTKKVNHPGQRRNPFISKAAQDAFAAGPITAEIIKIWNRKRIGSRKGFL